MSPIEEKLRLTAERPPTVHANPILYNESRPDREVANPGTEAAGSWPRHGTKHGQGVFCENPSNFGAQPNDTGWLWPPNLPGRKAEIEQAKKAETYRPSPTSKAYSVPYIKANIPKTPARQNPNWTALPCWTMLCNGFLHAHILGRSTDSSLARFLASSTRSNPLTRHDRTSEYQNEMQRPGITLQGRPTTQTTPSPSTRHSPKTTPAPRP
jgi:hypothetical protein